MADTAKRTECIKVCFEPRLAEDLKAKAFRDDRKVSDVVYVIVRRFMYGDVNGASRRLKPRTRTMNHPESSVVVQAPTKPQGLAQIPHRDGATYVHELDGQRLHRQHNRVCALMRDGSLAHLGRDRSCDRRPRGQRVRAPSGSEEAAFRLLPGGPPAPRARPLRIPPSRGATGAAGMRHPPLDQHQVITALRQAAADLFAGPVGNHRGPGVWARGFKPWASRRLETPWTERFGLSNCSSRIGRADDRVRRL
jgi:hypothetical protein